MAYFSKFGNFLNKHLTQIAGFAVAFGVSASMAPEVFFLSKCKKMNVYLEKDGTEKKIDPATQALIDKVGCNLKTDNYINYIKSAQFNFAHLDSIPL